VGIGANVLDSVATPAVKSFMLGILPTAFLGRLSSGVKQARRATWPPPVGAEGP
jgi:hypothetical protein